MTDRPKRPGRPKKARALRRTSIVWGSEAHHRFKRVLDKVIPAGEEEPCPAVLYQKYLPTWPPPGNPDNPRDHTCYGTPPHPECTPCNERKEIIAEAARQWNLTHHNQPTQWATNWFADALDYWQDNPQLSPDHPLRKAIPVAHSSDALGFFTVAAPGEVAEQERRRQQQDRPCPHCGRHQLRGWHISVPDAPRTESVAAWEEWRQAGIARINTIARVQKARLRSQATTEGLYPPSVHLCVFGWYQVGGRRRREAATKCGLAADASHISRITSEVARALGLTLRRPTGRGGTRA